MNQKLQPVRGMKDLLPDDFSLHAQTIAIARQVAMLHGFVEMSPPIVEATEVFKRTLGETSDVVSKEMYSFEDRGNHSLTLRPEFTAGVMRSILSSGAWNKLPLKYFSHGPLFRQERPQSNRYRQFHQINCEYIGGKTPEDDAAIIALAAQILKALGIADRITLHLNSIADTASRLAYRTRLTEYFQDYFHELSEDSQLRLEKNPLRILDSKDEKDKILVSKAPKIAEAYNPESHEFFERVQVALKSFGIEFIIDPHLVRGLDYYSHTTFEFVSDALGAQSTVLAGGRYDGLSPIMGGPELPAVGFASGIERLVALTNFTPQYAPSIAIIPIGSEAHAACIKTSEMTRESGIVTHLLFENNIGKAMKKADHLGVCHVILIGSDELAANVAKCKNFKTGAEQSIPLPQLISYLIEAV